LEDLISADLFWLWKARQKGQHGMSCMSRFGATLSLAERERLLSVEGIDLKALLTNKLLFISIRTLL